MKSVTQNPSLQILKIEKGWSGRFEAMASSCEILMDTEDEETALHLTTIAAEEVWRIEKKYSRYIPGNLIDKINSHEKVTVDDETALLINFAWSCFEISEGLFDITTGPLRKIWKFNGQSIQPPQQNQVDEALKHIGIEKIKWSSPSIYVPDGMELDLGGIGKEYAADCALSLVKTQSECGVVVNLGGDLSITGKRKDGRPWGIGIERWDQPGRASNIINVMEGALATSGDSKKFIKVNGRVYSHILNPKTGWPVDNAPHSVTVAAGTCSEAGFLSTSAMLKGKEAENFLKISGYPNWCYR